MKTLILKDTKSTSSKIKKNHINLIFVIYLDYISIDTFINEEKKVVQFKQIPNLAYKTFHVLTYLK